MEAKSKPPRAGGKWKPILLVKIYRLLRIGMTDSEVSKELGFSREQFWKWRKLMPELQEAVDLAKKELEESDSLQSWVYAKLSPELRNVWNKIEKLHKRKKGYADPCEIDNILLDQGKKARQQLFLHALCVGNYSPSTALSKINLSKKELDRWITSDPEFEELVQEMTWHKGNFFEGSLAQLVKEGNVAAVIFANKTFNSERGYAKVQQHQMEHTGAVLHGVMDLSDIMPELSEACKLELMQAIRKRDQKERPQLSVGERLAERIAQVPGEIIPG